MMNTKYVVRRAKHIGRGHLIDFTNRQDSFTISDSEHNGNQILVGIICDGCSEGQSSEVGATLATNFLAREAITLLKHDVFAFLLPSILYYRLGNFLSAIIGQYEFESESDRIGFIKDHLLFTVVGFILYKQSLVLFYAGDGAFVVNDEVFLIDSNNKPLYPAYHLVDRTNLDSDVSTLPETFDVLHYNLKEITRFAIGSDAWLSEQKLLDQIWGYKNPAGLQRKINIWSKTHHFRDDVSIITVEKE